MQINRKTTCCWFLAAGLFALTLPALNILTRQGERVTLSADFLFNTDILEGAAAVALYHAGVSWVPGRVVVGREGWLFLGDEFEATLRHTRGVETAQTTPRRTAQIVGQLRTNERWINGRGIPALFVIAPNKYSLYPEYHPRWLEVPEKSFTDHYVDLAEELGLRLLDLRPLLLAEKVGEHPLYYKLDSHWNQYAAYLGYRATIDRLNAEYGLQIKAVDGVTVHQEPLAGGGTSALIKINDFLPMGSDLEVAVHYEGESGDLVIQRLDRDTLAPSREAERGPNRAVAVGGTPHHIVNESAPNDLRVLWLRDSFGNNNSRYFHDTFREIWAVHLSHLHGAALEDFIRRESPDLVLYQVVERSIHGDIFRAAFPGGTP